MFDGQNTAVCLFVSFDLLNSSTNKQTEKELSMNLFNDKQQQQQNVIQLPFKWNKN